MLVRCPNDNDFKFRLMTYIYVIVLGKHPCMKYIYITRIERVKSKIPNLEQKFEIGALCQNYSIYVEKFKNGELGSKISLLRKYHPLKHLTLMKINSNQRIYTPDVHICKKSKWCFNTLDAAPYFLFPSCVRSKLYNIFSWNAYMTYKHFLKFDRNFCYSSI